MEKIRLNYFKGSDAIEGIGRAFPQIQTTEDNPPINAARQYLKFRDNDFLPEIELVFDRFIIEKSAKKTDNLSTSPFSMGKIFSNKIISILIKYNLPPFKVYPALIQKRNTTELHEGYNFFMVEKLLYRYLSYSDYEFTDTTDLKNKTPIRIKNFEEFKYLRYQKKRRIVNWIEDEDLIFNHEFPIDIDMFVVGIFNNNYYFSERLVEEFLKEKVTGLEFTKAENLYRYTT